MRLPVQLRKRNPDTHKGDYGHVLIVGASPGLTGAVCLCAQGSLRAGAGYVTVAVPASLNTIIEIKLTECMSLPLPQTASAGISLQAYRKVARFAGKADVLALGPGAGREPSTQKLLRKLIETAQKPVVIDADGINALCSHGACLAKAKKRNCILTPHEGEFSRLIKKPVDEVRRDRKGLANSFALKYNLVLVLKGNRTIVTDGERFFENPTGNPGMATAGSGDVLTGIISAFLAQGLPPFEAAASGVYMHGYAGDLASRAKGQVSLIAGDIIEYLPQAFLKSARK